MSDAKPLDDLVDAGDVLMLTTTQPDLAARPVTVAAVEDGLLRFLVSAEAAWVSPLTRTHDTSPSPVGLSLVERGSYVTLSGYAAAEQDADLASRLWSPAAKAFFTGPDDPDLRVLTVEVLRGEWWDTPATGVGRVVALAAALVTDDSSATGSSGPVDASS